MAQPLPTSDAILDARAWLHAGAPAARPDHDAVGAVRTLLDLIAALPAHLPVYAFGSPEWHAARDREEATL